MKVSPEAEIYYKAVNRAYEVLKTAEGRTSYDITGQQTAVYDTHKKKFVESGTKTLTGVTSPLWYIDGQKCTMPNNDFNEWPINERSLSDVVLASKCCMRVNHKGKEIARILYGRRYGINTGDISWIFVNPECRKKHIGNYLLQEAINNLRAQGVQTIELIAVNKSTRLYQRFGFVQPDKSWGRMVLELPTKEC